MVIGFVQGYEELKWRISKLNPLCNGPLTRLLSATILRDWSLIMGRGGGSYKMRKSDFFCPPPSRQGKTFHVPL